MILRSQSERSSHPAEILAPGFGPARGQIANAHDMQRIHGVRGVALVHNGNDAAPDGDEIAVWHIELATIRKVNDKRRERPVQPVPERIQIQHDGTLAVSAPADKFHTVFTAA